MGNCMALVIVSKKRLYDEEDACKGRVSHSEGGNMSLALVALSKLTACESGLRTRGEVRRTRRTLWLVSHMKSEETCDCMWSYDIPRIKRKHNSAVQMVKNPERPGVNPRVKTS